MRNIPVFPTESGVSSLVLEELPYRRCAYIHLRDVQPDGLEAHLAECVAFCRGAGAERVYATGRQGLEGYPLYTQVVELRGTAWVDPEKLAHLFPVTEATVSRWREVYNGRMRGVDNARTLERRDEASILDSGGAYFVHRAGTLLGIGWLEGCRLLAMAAVRPGAGETVMHTLMSTLEGADMVLEAASTNTRALALYERLGFVQTREVLRWYRIF